MKLLPVNKLTVDWNQGIGETISQPWTLWAVLPLASTFESHLPNNFRLLSKAVTLVRSTHGRSNNFSQFWFCSQKKAKTLSALGWYHKTWQYSLPRISACSDVESVIDIYCSGSHIVFSPSMLHFKCMISLSLLRGRVGRWLELVVLLVLM